MLSMTADAGGRIFMEFESPKENWMVAMWKLDWNRLMQVYAYEDEYFLRINRVKIKTVFLKSNIIFKVF